MMTGIGVQVRLWMAGAGALALAGCTTSEWAAVADGLNMVAAESSVTLAQVQPYSCGLNAQRDPVCDDDGDGFADRYGDPSYEYVHGWYYETPTRINDYGEAFQYDGGCDCWRREPSLDTYPQ